MDQVSHTCSSNYLDLLPVELIQEIFTYLGNDLVAHVTFSKLRPYIYECCYKGLGRKFWEPKLRASGLSYSDEDEEMHIHEFSDEDWEQFAADHVEHAETCQYSGCGMAILRKHERLMQRSVALGLDIMHTVIPNIPAYTPLVQQMTTSEVWESIMFKRPADSIDHWHSRYTWQAATRIRANDIAGGARNLKYGNKLVHHPTITQSFATFPPVAKVLIKAPNGQYPYWSIKNPRGVTVADILVEIMAHVIGRIGQPIDLRGLLAEVQRPEGKTRAEDRVVPKDWTLEDTLDAARDMRDFLILVRWTGFDIGMDPDSGVVCYWKFAIQDLPEDYHEFLRTTTYFEGDDE